MCCFFFISLMIDMFLFIEYIYLKSSIYISYYQLCIMIYQQTPVMIYLDNMSYHILPYSMGFVDDVQDQLTTVGHPNCHLSISYISATSITVRHVRHVWFSPWKVYQCEVHKNNSSANGNQFVYLIIVWDAWSSSSFIWLTFAGCLFSFCLHATVLYRCSTVLCGHST